MRLGVGLGFRGQTIKCIEDDLCLCVVGASNADLAFPTVLCIQDGEGSSAAL